jgi:hypothetical protein
MSDDELYSGTAAGLLRFLGYSAEKGLINPTTARARRSACTKVLEIDGPDWRQQPVADIDAEDQLARFSRKSGGKYSPGSLATYGQRFRDAVNDYLQFLSNPTGYRGPKPRARSRTGSSQGAPPASGRTSSPGQAASATNAVPDDAAPAAPGRDTGLITYPFPLASGALGYVQLPREVTPTDIERLCHFVRSLAIDEPSDATSGPGQS